MQLPKLRWWQWTLVALGGLILVGLFQPADQRPVATTGTTVRGGATPPARSLSRAAFVESAATSGDILTVRMLADGLDEPGLTGQSGYRIQQVAKAYQRGVAEDAAAVATVRFALDVDLVDRLGNESREPFAQIDFSAADLRSAKFDNLGPAQVLDLAKAVRPSAQGARSMAAWCAKNADAASNFCALAG